MFCIYIYVYIACTSAEEQLSVFRFFSKFLLFNISKAHYSYKPKLPDCFLGSLALCYPLHCVLLLPFPVLGQCRNSTEPKRLPTTEEEQIYPWDTCAALHDVRLTTLQRYFKDVRISWEQDCCLRKIRM